MRRGCSSHVQSQIPPTRVADSAAFFAHLEQTTIATRFASQMGCAAMDCCCHGTVVAARYSGVQSSTHHRMLALRVSPRTVQFEELPPIPSFGCEWFDTAESKLSNVHWLVQGCRSALSLGPSVHWHMPIYYI